MQAGYYIPEYKQRRDLHFRKNNRKRDNALYGLEAKADELVKQAEQGVYDMSTQTDFKSPDASTNTTNTRDASTQDSITTVQSQISPNVLASQNPQLSQTSIINPNVNIGTSPTLRPQLDVTMTPFTSPSQTPVATVKETSPNTVSQATPQEIPTEIKKPDISPKKDISPLHSPAVKEVIETLAADKLLSNIKAKDKLIEMIKYFQQLHGNRVKTITINPNKATTAFKIGITQKGNQLSATIKPMENGKFKSGNPIAIITNEFKYPENIDITYSLTDSINKAITNFNKVINNSEDKPEIKLASQTVIDGLGLSKINYPHFVQKVNSKDRMMFHLPEFIRGNIKYYDDSTKDNIAILHASKPAMKIINDIVKAGTFSEKDYKEIKPEEVKQMNEIIVKTKAMIPSSLDFRLFHEDDLKSLKDRYQVLVGELSAGNKGSLVKDEMIAILQKLRKLKAIKVSKANDLIKGLREF